MYRSVLGHTHNMFLILRARQSAITIQKCSFVVVGKCTGVVLEVQLSVGVKQGAAC